MRYQLKVAKLSAYQSDWLQYELTGSYQLHVSQRKGGIPRKKPGEGEYMLYKPALGAALEQYDWIVK